MSSYTTIWLGCALSLSGCANNAAKDLAVSGRPRVSADAGAGENSGGSNGVGMTSGANSDLDPDADQEDGGTAAAGTGGASTAGSATTGGNAGGTSAGALDAGANMPTSASGVIISEVMARPDAGSDNEWIEIFNAGTN